MDWAPLLSQPLPNVSWLRPSHVSAVSNVSPQWTRIVLYPLHLVSVHRLYIACPRILGCPCNLDCHWLVLWLTLNCCLSSLFVYIICFIFSSKQAVWVPVPQSVKEAVIMKDLDFRAGLHTASHVVLNVVPLWVPYTCDFHITVSLSFAFFSKFVQLHFSKPVYCIACMVYILIYSLPPESDSLKNLKHVCYDSNGCVRLTALWCFGMQTNNMQLIRLGSRVYKPFFPLLPGKDSIIWPASRRKWCLCTGENWSIITFAEESLVLFIFTFYKKVIFLMLWSLITLCSTI